MHFESLHALNFRNLRDLQLELTADPVVLRGPNAQGKTNILESLYLCATGRSFRNAGPRELLAHSSPKGWIRARFVRQGVRHDIEVHLEPHRRSVRIDGRGLKQTAHLLELLNVVAFFPDDLRIAKGSPEERRRFLDRAVANNHPGFYRAAVAYQRALRTRNAVLRAQASVDRRLLAVYDEQLVEHGTIIHACRQSTLSELAPLAQERFQTMMGRHTPLALALQDGVSDGLTAGDAQTFPESFRSALQRSFPKDRARGMTTVGPHRADLVLHVAAQDARIFASQGQQRALVLALKLAEVQRLAQRLGAPPILLLDDVSSELDRQRTQQLFDEVEKLKAQVWVSTTGAAPLPLMPSAQVFDVANGSITPVGR